jgi:hypothetical protein
MKASDLRELGFEYAGLPRIERGKLTASIVRVGGTYRQQPHMHHDSVLHKPDPVYRFDDNSGCVTARVYSAPNAVVRLLRRLHLVATPTDERMESRVRLTAEALVYELVCRIELQSVLNKTDAALSQRLTEAAFPSDD